MTLDGAMEDYYQRTGKWVNVHRNAHGWTAHTQDQSYSVGSVAEIIFLLGELL